MASANLYTAINKATLKSLKPSFKERFIKDTKQPGFQIKILPSGKTTYLVEARLGGIGKVKKFKIGNVGELPLDIARDKAREALTLIKNNIDPQTKKRQERLHGVSLSEVWEKKRDTSPKKLATRTISDYEGFLSRELKHFARKRVKDITSQEIREWYEKGSKTPTRTDNAFRALNALMNYAVGLDLIDQNPCDKIIKAKHRYKRTARTRYLEPNRDLPKFMRAFYDYPYQKDSQITARDLILLLLNTGLRFSEAASIRFDFIDWYNKILTIHDTKNHQKHFVPLTPMTFTMFFYRHEKRCEQNNPYVFRIKGGKTKSPYVTDIRKTIKGICDLADIDHISPHDIRRTFASSLNEIGVGHYDEKALLNHKDKDITFQYIQNNIERSRDHLYKLGDYYDSKIEFPDNPKKGWEKSGSHVIQSKFYGNIGAQFSPLSVNDRFEAERQDFMEDDYWYGDSALKD